MPAVRGNCVQRIKNLPCGVLEISSMRRLLQAERSLPQCFLFRILIRYSSSSTFGEPLIVDRLGICSR